MDWWQYALLTGVGVVAGFLNVMAGGGSLITMPMMIFLGLEPATANGTNRVAILLQNVTAVGSFRRHGFFDLPLSLNLALCTVPGAVAGALLAVEIDPALFKRLLGGVLLLSLLAMARGRGGSKSDRRYPVWAHLAAVATGFYGGFMQAGVGFLLMPILHHLLALDLVRVNMHKVFIIGVYTLPSLLVFAVEDHVLWSAGIALALGNVLGAWIGTRVTVTRGDRAVRIVFFAAVVAMALKLLIG